MAWLHVPWPAEVDLPDDIGTGQYVDQGGPCCPTGRFAYALDPDRPCYAMATVEFDMLDIAFRRAAVLLTGIKPGKYSILGFNDQILTPEQRVLCYAAAWAYAGYHIHGFPEAARLGSKLRRTYGPLE